LFLAFDEDGYYIQFVINAEGVYNPFFKKSEPMPKAFLKFFNKESNNIKALRLASRLPLSA